MFVSSIDIPDDKNVVILSHPRSGSSWFQSCLPHYNCFEAFNTKFMDIKQLSINPPKFSFPVRSESNNLSSEETTNLIIKRMKMLELIKSPISVKVHYSYMENIIADWIIKQNPTVIDIARKDKISTFKSLCISLYYKKFYNNHPTDPIKITVDDNIKKIHSSIYSIPESAKRILDKFDTKTFYYEDLMTHELTSRNPRPIIQQNTKEIIIENWEEILNYLDRNKLSLC